MCSRKQVKIFSLLCIGSIFFWLAWAQTTYACATCTKAPSDLELYFSVMDKLLGVLDTPPYQQWTGNQFAEDGKELLFTAKTAIQSVAATTMMNFVLEVHTAFLDVGAEMKTLAWTQARRRDRELLLSYDRKIMMKWLSIGQRAYMGKNVSEEQLKKIDQILAELEYVELNKVGWWYVSLLKQATYDDILGLYRNMNYLYKKLHQKKWFHNDLEKIGSEYNVVDELKKADTVEKPEKEGLQNFRNQLQILVEAVFLEQQSENRWATAQLLNFKEWHKLFAAYVWQIQQDYACAIWTKNQCDSTWTKAVSDSRNNTKWRTADVQKSMKMFADAWARLKWALRSKDPDAIKAAQQREEALLNSFYGWNIPPERRRFDDNPLLDNWSNPGVNVQGQLNIEESSADTQALVRRLQDSFKKKDDGTREKEEVITHALSLSNLPQGDTQDDANKYPSRSEKKDALNKYIEQTVATRWLDQEIELQWVFAGQKREIQAAIVMKNFTDVFALQQEREKEAIFGDVRSATTLFPVLSASVWRNIELRWDKNEPSGKETSTIYNSAGKVCELQCSNLQGKCWYYTN